MSLRWLRTRGWSPVLALLTLVTIQAQGADATGPSEKEIAKQIDAALGKANSAPLPAPADDATFLRRVSLDLTGKLPTPKEVEDFLADKDSNKRARKIDQLLNSDAYAVNWGRY